MKRALLLVLILAVDSTGWIKDAEAKENYSSVLRDQYGRAIGGATVRVYIAGTSTLATLYSDNIGTIKSNPFLTNTFDGRYNFYAANGTYDITFTYPGATFDISHTKRIGVFDVADFSGGGGGGSYTVLPVSSSATLSGSHTLVRCDATSGAVTLTLPLAATIAGADFLVKKIDSTANACTVIRAGSDTIDGGTSVSLTIEGHTLGFAAGGATAWDIY
jgi:hypothetical protein